MEEAPPDAIDALWLAAAPGYEQRRDLEAEIARARVLARLTGRAEARARLGNFDLVRCVGRGGMGKVFEARDRETGATVALKVLYDPPDQALARLKREFRALRDVSHPHLVAMYELHVEEQLPFFTMELVDGPSLAQLLDEGARLDADFLARLVLQLSTALAAIHAQGTVHGDIKPANLLLRGGEQLILVDFGVARALGDARPSGSSGTPAYMAPERLAGQLPDPASDFYALGAVLHELLAGLSLAPTDPDTERVHELQALCLGLREHDPRRRFGVREIFDALGAANPEPGFVWPEQDAPCVGRALELSQLQQALARVDAGPVVCSVSGEPGIGKTVLIERFLASLEATEALALRGRCYEDESLPYKGLEGAVESLAAHLEALPQVTRAALVPSHVDALLQLFPALCRAGLAAPPASSATVEPRLARHRAFAALTELLGRVARQRQLVLFLDDLQWGDADGAALLQHLLSAPKAPALLLVVSFRSDATGPCVEALAAAPAPALQIQLGPLAASACDALARELTGDSLPSPVRDSLMRESGGSPLLLHALLRAGPALDETRSYAQLIARVVAALDAGARELLLLVALAGSPVTPSLLAAATAPGAPARRWLPVLRGQRLVRSVAHDGGSLLVPHHDRVREVVTALLTQAEREHLHARLAHAASATDVDDPEFLAHHYFRARQLTLAAPHAERAGDRARAAMALGRAHELYARALECVAPARPVALVEKLAEVAAAAGDLKLAGPLYLEAAAARPEQGWKLRLRAAEVHLLRGAEADAMALLGPALRQARIPVPANMPYAVLLGLTSLARCQWRATRVAPAAADDDLKTELSFRIGYMMTLHDPKGVALSLWSAARALHHGSAPQQGRALATLAHAHSLLRVGSLQHQDTMVERALALTQSAPLAHACALACKALIACGRSQCDVALATLDQAAAQIVDQRLDVLWMLAQIHTLVASVCVLGGNFQRIRAFADEAEREAREVGNGTVLTQIQSSRAWACLAADDPGVMQRYAAETFEIWRTPRLTPLYGLAVWGECHRLLYLGEHEAAHALMRREAPRFVRAGLTSTQSWRIALDQTWGNVELSCAQRPGDRYTRAAEHHARRLAREPVPWGRACAALLYAGLARQAGQSAAAARSYREARQRFEALGMLGYAAVAAYRSRQLEGARPGALEASLPWFASQAVAAPGRWVHMLAP